MSKKFVWKDGDIVITKKNIPAAKSYDFYLRTLQNITRNLYEGRIGGEFKEILHSLILGQISDAFDKAALDNGMDELTPELFSAMMTMIDSEREHIDGFYQAIVNARVDGTPVEPLLQRAKLWANRWKEAYEQAQHLITASMGGKEEWVMDEEKENCPTCLSLNGKVAFATEWDKAGFKPQHPPNDLLDCGGWDCGCERKPTNKRRSPKVLDTLLDIAAARAL